MYWFCNQRSVLIGNTAGGRTRVARLMRKPFRSLIWHVVSSLHTCPAGCLRDSRQVSNLSVLDRIRPFFSGEVTEALQSWYHTALRKAEIYASLSVPSSSAVMPAKKRMHWQQSPPALLKHDLRIWVRAADPVSRSSISEFQLSLTIATI